jgi:hypothetical protein
VDQLGQPVWAAVQWHRGKDGRSSAWDTVEEAQGTQERPTAHMGISTQCLVRSKARQGHSVPLTTDRLGNQKRVEAVDCWLLHGLYERLDVLMSQVGFDGDMRMTVTLSQRGSKSRFVSIFSNPHSEALQTMTQLASSVSDG